MFDYFILFYMGVGNLFTDCAIARANLVVTWHSKMAALYVRHSFSRME